MKYKEWIDKKEKDEDWYTYIFGDVLIKNDISEVKSSELSSGSGKIIGLYFSDNKFSECLKFTSKLISIYEQNKRQENELEVVLISNDSSLEQFKLHFNEMPWFAIPFSNEVIRKDCSYTFDILNLPTLVFLNAENGHIITLDGKSVIEELGHAAFPFTLDEIEYIDQLDLIPFMNKTNEEKWLLKKEVKLAWLQEKLEKFPIHRHRGRPKDVTITIEHRIKFRNFSTITGSWSNGISRGKNSFL